MSGPLLLLTLALLVMSLMTQYLPPYGKKFLKISTIHWPIALLCLVGSILLFGFGPFLPPVTLTLANTFYSSTLFSLGLVLMALEKKNPRWGLNWFFAAAAVFALVFEVLRQQGSSSFALRTVLVASTINAGALFLAYAVTQHSFRPRSIHLYFVAFFGLVSGLLLAKRAALIYAGNIPSNFSLFQEEGLSLQLRWMASIGLYLTYFMMRNHLGERIQHRSDRENRRAEEALLFTLQSMAVARNSQTENHMQRLQRFVQLTLRSLRQNSRYAGQLSEKNINQMVQACVLHDIGKMALPYDLLFTDAPASESEMAEMMSHTTVGERILQSAMASHPEQPSRHMERLLAVATEIAGGHHERWDGAGYPRRLAGEDIPLAARVVAVADAFDVLLTSRVYKEIWSVNEALICLERQSGTAFDPDVMDAFLLNSQEVQTVARTFRD